MGRFRDAQRWLGTGGDRRTYGNRLKPACTEFRARRIRGSIQRDRTRQAATRYANANARPQKRKALPGLRRTGRRQPGSEPVAVLLKRSRVWDDRAGGD